MRVLCITSAIIWIVAATSVIAQTPFTIPLGIGTKLYYNGPVGGPIAQTYSVYIIADSASNGYMTVRVEGTATFLYTTEYWCYSGGRFYRQQSPYPLSSCTPFYISSLTKDSVAGNVSWKKEKISYFGKTYDSQICRVYTNSGPGGAYSYATSYRITDGLGITEATNEFVSGGTVRQYLIGIEVDGKLTGSAIPGITAVHADAQRPDVITLNQNYPNPFNPSTTITFSLATETFVALKVYDVMGKEIATIAAEEMGPGPHKLHWDAVGLPSGVYFYTLRAGAFTETKRLLLER